MGLAEYHDYTAVQHNGQRGSWLSMAVMCLRLPTPRNRVGGAMSALPFRFGCSARTVAKQNPLYYANAASAMYLRNLWPSREGGWSCVLRQQYGPG